jgi:hypothetical protein
VAEEHERARAAFRYVQADAVRLDEAMRDFLHE